MTSQSMKGLPLLAAGLALVVACPARSAPVPTRNIAFPKDLFLEIVLPPLGLADAKEAKQPALDLRGTSMQKYGARVDPKSAIQNAVREAHLLLWASSPAPAPKTLEKEVAKRRKELKIDPAALKTRFSIPAPGVAEKRFREQLVTTCKDVARLVARLEDVLEELQKLEEVRAKETPRWQANLDLIRVSLMARISHLEEYSITLGSMRKETPPYTNKDSAWRLKPRAVLRDFSSKKRMKEAAKILQRLSREHAGTVWEQQAERVKRTLLGVAWEAVP